MPRGVWTEKDERQYEHVKDSERKRGRRLDRAKEIAARTVNKQRRLEGRTERAQTLGTGNPAVRLDDRPKAELMNRARQLRIKGRSQMAKSDLVRAIRIYQ